MNEHTHTHKTYKYIKQSMVDAAIDMQKDLYPSKSTDSLIALKSDVTSEYERLSSSPELHYISSTDKDESKESIPTESELNTILTYAKFMFEAGQYEESCKALTFYTENSNSSDLSSSFGLLSSQILSGESSAAIKTIQQIRQAIEESESSSPLFKLQNRTWLIHWAMHAFFQLEDPATHIVDFFFSTQQRETESGRVIRSRDYEYLKVCEIFLKSHYKFENYLNQHHHFEHRYCKLHALGSYDTSPPRS